VGFRGPPLVALWASLWGVVWGAGRSLGALVVPLWRCRLGFPFVLCSLFAVACRSFVGCVMSVSLFVVPVRSFVPPVRWSAYACSVVRPAGLVRLPGGGWSAWARPFLVGPGGR